MTDPTTAEHYMVSGVTNAGILDADAHAVVQEAQHTLHRVLDRCHEADAADERHRRSVDDIWGPEPLYAQQPEDAGGWLLGSFFYSWIGDFMYRAAREELTAEQLPRPTLAHRACTAGRALSRELDAQHRQRHLWDKLVGVVGARSRKRGGEGALRYVGPVQQFRDANKKAGGSTAVLYGGVVWEEAPKKAERIANGPGSLHNGTVHGEKLFELADGEAVASCEHVKELQLQLYPSNTLNTATTLTASDKAALRLLDKRIPDRLTATPQPVSIIRALTRALGMQVLQALPFRIAKDACMLLSPVFLQFIIAYLEAGDTSRWTHGALLVFALFAVLSIDCCVSNKYTQICGRCRITFQNAMITSLFEKCLTISSKSMAEPDLSAGKLINMMSGDVSSIASVVNFMWMLLAAPVQLVAAVFLLYRLVNFAAFIGIAILVAFLPVQGIIMTFMFKSFRTKAMATDARLKATNEFFAGVRVAKFMSWEPSFVANIEEKREAEVRQIRRIRFFIMLITFFMNAAPSVVIASVFFTFVKAGHPLTPSIVFPAISVLGILETPFHFLPMAAQLVSRCLVSARRINRFLEAEDGTYKDAVEVLSAADNRESAHHAHDGSSSMQEDQIQAECWSAVAAAFSNTRLTAYMGHKLPSLQEAMQAEEDATAAAAAAAAESSDSHPSPSPSPPPPQAPATPAGPSATEDAVYELRPKHILQDVTLRIPRGKLTVIIGATGAGKSTLLNSLIGGVEVSAGHVRAEPSIAYVPQQPWIMNASLQENVVFFSDMDAGRFDLALSSSQLKSDLRLLSDGVRTEIGERGINLSGGQKARVSLARAVYADKELYLLDDPLSALDAHVGDLVLRDCILGALATKTRILATHHHHALQYADHIVLIENGTVTFTGSLQGYRAFAPAADTSSSSRGVSPTTTTVKELPTLNQNDADAAMASASAEEAKAAGEGKEEKDAQQQHGPPSSASGTPAAARLTTDEEMASGSVGFNTYTRYAMACGGWWVCSALALLYTVTEVAFVAPQLWLSVWSTDSYHLPTTTYLRIYIGLTVFSTVCSPMRYWTATSVMLRAGVNLHSQLVRSVASATLSFFDTTPLGRILNRFSKDMEKLDDDLIGDYLMLAGSLCSLVSSTSIVLSTQVFVIVVFIPLAYIYRKLLRFYNAANRHLQRIANVSHSPIFLSLSETLGGRWTLEAYGKSHAMMQTALQRLDVVYAATYMDNVGDRWLSVRIEFITAVIVTSVAAAAIMSLHMPTVFPLHVGMVALSLTMAMKTSWTLKNVIMQIASVEADMNSIERVATYIDDIPHEEGAAASLDEEVTAHRERNKERQKHATESATSTTTTTTDNIITPEVEETDPLLGLNDHDAVVRVPMEQQQSSAVVVGGTLEFRNVNMRYRDGLPLVLRDVSFSIAAGQKVGVVGRTGSGKSSLLLAFLRLVDICDGEMIVCGRPAGSYKLRELRSLFSMIPQDPLLFDGTVRSNVDPFAESSDAAVWDALRHVGMLERVRSEEGGLDSRVTEGGQNFSVGQRQLLCLARALLKKGSTFLLMDEATANVDPTLDSAIQSTVQREFRDYTVITIAHRLHTVACYDRILMIDEGRVVAYGSPHELVSTAGSPFAQLVNSMGEEAKQVFMDALAS